MRIGVLGGGQLGRMLGLAGIPLGHEFRFFDPSDEVAAANVGEVVRGDYADVAMLEAFVEGLDVVTFEFENVPASALDAISERVQIWPPRQALNVSQDRVREKSFFGEVGIATGEWRQVDSTEDLAAAVRDMGSCIIKTRQFGYDGKGQVRIGDASMAAEAWEQLGRVPCIAEKLVAFDRELSIIGVRGGDGQIRCWPLVENVHHNGILHRSTAPAVNLDASLQGQAEKMLSAVMTELGYVGVLTMELFDVGGQLLANEIAPRVHNSGHWTIEGSVTSQFENHIRAICDLPLGMTESVDSVMVNCIGSMPARQIVMAMEGVHFHDYGKSARTGRKVGHLTVCKDNLAMADFDKKVACLEELAIRAR